MTSPQDNVRLLARILLKKVGIHTPPVDVLRITDYLGAEVVFSDEFPDGIFGCLLPLKNGKFIIAINVYSSDTRKIFTIAYEIGHICLKHYEALEKLYSEKEKIALDVSQIETCKAIMERYANVFASELLMPKHMVLPHYYKTNGDVDKLAEIFMVSKEAMEIRLKELNLK
ncbi:MAG: ImmA/IrrE family metallo-endopeptidase [Candidatus Methanofastidiosum sp.]|nr:ImmA/IrrE family metallo-endopeptidase [Methanofastidiosum sp.]